VDRDS